MESPIDPETNRIIERHLRHASALQVISEFRKLTHNEQVFCDRVTRVKSKIQELESYVNDACLAERDIV